MCGAERSKTTYPSAHTPMRIASGISSQTAPPITSAALGASASMIAWRACWTITASGLHMISRRRLSSGIEPRWSWLEIVPLVGALALLSTGIGTLLAALFVRYRDVRPIWDVILQISFYGSPILYPIEKIPEENLRRLIMCNPLAVIVQQARHAIIDPGAPSAAEAMGGAVWLLIPLAVLIGVCTLGFFVFDRSAPHIAEEL